MVQTQRHVVHWASLADKARQNSLNGVKKDECSWKPSLEGADEGKVESVQGQEVEEVRGACTGMTENKHWPLVDNCLFDLGTI